MKTNRATFANARMESEGSFATAQGSMVQTIYVDLTGELSREALCLAKASEPQFDLRTADTTRLSRPSVFQKAGEGLIRDEQEGRARTSTRETIKGPTSATTQLDRRVRAINAGLRLSETKLNVRSRQGEKRTNTSTSAVTFGKDWLIYCTSLWPGVGQEDAWRREFPENYTNVVRIHRPTQFAQALGMGVCEHIGANGKPSPMKTTFHGFQTVEMRRATQIVLHGPVLYVGNPYRCINEAQDGWAKICSMIFVKSSKYVAQQEYRFAMLSIPPDVGEVFDLPVSGILRDCLLPAKMPLGPANGPETMARDARERREQRESHRGYTYRRRRVRRESGSWSDGEPGDERVKEEIIEETVTSPEEIPEPFPEEAKRPDIIMFEVIGGQLRFNHRIYRDEETRRIRIETLPMNPAIIDSPNPGGPSYGLEVPSEDRFEALHVRPTDPRVVLELFHNPSTPRPPGHYEVLAQCSRSDLAHVLACWRSLGAAVDLLEGEDRERAASAAWYAAEFIVDLVSRFGPIVRTLCVIRECVVVVEFKRAPISGAVGWATFSGTETYTLYVQRDNVEEIVYPFRARTGRMGPGTYAETLQEYGWPPRTP